jgi:outer membrane immunogenic protein
MRSIIAIGLTALGTCGGGAKGQRGRTMIKIIYASAMLFGLALAGPAFAADIPLKAPAQPVYSGWGGWYVGVEAGEKWKTDKWTTDCVQQSANPLFACGTVRNAIQYPGAPDATSPHNFKNSGARIGGYIGANTQQGLWVYGFEADWAHYDQSSSVVGLVGATICCLAGLPGTTPANDRTSVTNKWDASLRVRGGYLIMPEVLLYATGGFALQQLSSTMSCNGATSPACSALSLTQTNSDILPGWTIGGGLEWKIVSNLILRGEYRFSDFGSVRSNFFQNSGDVELLSRIKVTSQIATVGLAYKFDWWR